ncbi:M56 family metallopeptidase [Crassaminicella profunda]|uniref:M56 family metallopeptidase n=1 Tax=Crassaminicella profunda TaxID=1286698 RepID=UPI001CA762EE|nr:M56 family metallopeptidase [Crassaminicella profunda]QZY56923.1 M56 family metallopeptidase [Crassaminicella profunda]
MNPFIGILNNLINMVIKTSLRASVLIVLIFIVKFVLRQKINAKFQYGIWYLLLISLMIPQMPESHLSIYNIPKYFQQNETIIQSSLVTEDNVTQENIFLTNLIPPKVIKKSSLTHKENQLSSIFYIWISGVLIIGLYILYKNLSLYKLIQKGDEIVDETKLNGLRKCKDRMNIKKEVKMLKTEAFNVPVLFGVIHPKIIFPREMIYDFDDKQLEYIMLHELSHLKRKDLFINWIILVFQLIHWFNPLIWIGFYEMKNDVELACDALVLNHLNKKEHVAYGKVILDLLEYLSKPKFIHVTANLLENKREVKRRIIMIKKFNKNSYKITILGLIIIALVGCSAISSPISNNNEKADTKIEEKGKNTSEAEDIDTSLPPKELIENNIEGTDVTVALEVIAANQLEKDAKDDLYVTYKIKAKLINVYKGEYEVDDEIEFYKTIEDDKDYEKTNPFINKKLIVSFVYSEDKQLQIPDVAYDFIYSEELNTLFESVAKK